MTAAVDAQVREGATLAAIRDIVPVAVSVVPFAVIIGSVMRQAGFPLATGLVGGAGMYGGTAQLAAVTMLVAGADVAFILGVVVVVNARLLLYGAALEPMFHCQPRWFRWLGPQFVVDQTFALATARTDLSDPARFRRYWMTLGLVLGVVWTGAMAGGMVLGAAIPPTSPLTFAAPAVLIALLVPRVRTPGGPVVAGVAGVVAVAAADLPNGLGIGAGMLAGLAAAAAMDRRRR